MSGARIYLAVASAVLVAGCFWAVTAAARETGRRRGEDVRRDSPENVWATFAVGFFAGLGVAGFLWSVSG